ncbi:CsbD family protein [Gelidibacter salicanalis]|uniref:CsbD family protein n=1 Tax=Gelidibacter salicanalis TaxID=291193 RepID=A0A5C7AMC4_9FLAO|nr:CsbD family protein [Gelidibacter salicanalis]TXE07715.1 CsbD family protein [Gelidibacter salicanalis]
MNSDQFEGKWKQIKGDFKKKYGEITDDEYTEAEGNFDKLAGKVQERYGKSKEDLKNEIDSW